MGAGPGTKRPRLDLSTGRRTATRPERHRRKIRRNAARLRGGPFIRLVDNPNNTQASFPLPDSALVSSAGLGLPPETNFFHSTHTNGPPNFVPECCLRHALNAHEIETRLRRA